MFIDHDAQNYIFIHFMCWHKDMARSPFHYQSQPYDSGKAKGIRFIHFPCCSGGQLMSEDKQSALKWKKSSKQAPSPSYARVTSLPRADTVTREVKGGKLTARRRGTVRDRAHNTTWQEAERGGILSERWDKKLSRGDSAELWSAKVHGGLGIPLLESKSWVRGRSNGTSNDLQAGKTDLKKVKTVKARQLLDIWRVERQRTDKSLNGGQKIIWLGSLCVCTVLRDCSEIL